MELKSVAVIGAGNMGSGIAQKIATEGVPVVLIDSSQERADAGKARIGKLLGEGVERKLFTPAQVQEILSRIVPKGDVAAAKDADVVIEAVFEDIQVKRELFKKLASVCRADTLFATNTSSFLVADMLEGVAHPERVIGLHYFYHPAKNRLVEVIGHEKSDPALLRKAWAFQERVGKIPIASADAPGFVVNRFFVPWLNEAVRLHEEGISIATIEAAAKQSFGVGMGPFQLMNVTGVAITLHATTSLAKQLGKFYAPASSLKPVVDANLPWELAGEPDAAAFQKVNERLWGVVFHVAAQLVSEDVGTLADTDLGARVGLRWPVGPFEKMNEVGVAEAARLSRLIEERYELASPKLLSAQLAKQTPFKLSRVGLSVFDGVATVRIERPDQLNALDPETIAQIEERFLEAEARADVKTIIIAGAGKAFVAGADIKFFVDRMKSGRLPEIQSFGEQGQRVFRRIEKSNKRVVCALDGLALGGGAELALACHVIVATPRARFGFPETGIGIYPGLGGTQRLTRRLGTGLARMLLYSGNQLGANELLATKLAWRIVAPDALAETARQAGVEATVQEKLAHIPGPLAKAAKFFEENAVHALFDAGLPLPEDASIADAVKKLRRKAPRALAEVERLTALAATTDLDAGLAAESKGLAGVFASRDALEGMQAVLEKRFPKFSGA